MVSSQDRLYTLNADSDFRGFNEVVSPTDGTLVYYQSWEDGTPSVNMGTNGLENFGTVQSPIHKTMLLILLIRFGSRDREGSRSAPHCDIVGSNLRFDTNCNARLTFIVGQITGLIMAEWMCM